MSKSPLIQIRKSGHRGHADHGWLNSFHTFSFAFYQDDRFDNFHSLRVINEDRVMPTEGFGTHSHANFEIFSYIVKGELTHRDSMGNVETLKRGDVQFTSAGSGISHSEFNEHDKEMVHFIQMWVKPDRRGLKPYYSTKTFAEEDKIGKLVPIVSGQKSIGDGPININQDITVYASILTPGQEIEHKVEEGREVYIHVIQDSVDMTTDAKKVSLLLNDDVELGSGDGAFIKNTADGVTLKLKGNSAVEGVGTEFLLFDVVKM
jgi:redox-sensitive bicupin YhaK (pirin superfamily)